MQIRHVYIFMGLLTWSCRQPDRQPSVEPTVRATANEIAVGPRTDPNETQPARPATCVVPMPVEPMPAATAAANCPAASERLVELTRGQITFDEAPSRPTLEVELARTDEAKHLGLMYRTRLASEAGMLFVWDDEAPRSFWMHNTCIPLDMLFISKDRTIAGVLEQVPVLNEQSRGIPCPVAYVLEVNAGWVRGHRVAPGQHLTLSMP